MPCTWRPPNSPPPRRARFRGLPPIASPRAPRGLQKLVKTHTYSLTTQPRASWPSFPSSLIYSRTRALHGGLVALTHGPASGRALFGAPRSP
eukprot:scaffold1904_cov375-Prasinococcus_capsulatus_cf.AAC.2